MADQEHTNRSHGQRMRRMQEQIDTLSMVDHAVIEVVVEHSRDINDLNERMTAVEQERSRQNG